MQTLSPKVDLTTHSCSDSDQDRVERELVPHYTLLIQNTGGKIPSWRVSVSLQTGVCPSVELSPSELAFFHWTKCRKKEERPREDGRGERGLQTPPAPPPPSTVTDGKTLSLLTGGYSHPFLSSPLLSIFLAQKPSK